ncbi:uncharacterized protein LOC143895514 [Temnothorax americanus]|uniref:uncharacterized protein LOC143895514 n=1 Tax=Temnothorax americanus TaxID=1964332 RepID=UPI004068F043
MRYALPFVLRNIRAHEGIVHLQTLVVAVECKGTREFTDDRSANRLATEPSVIQEIPLSMEKSGLRSVRLGRCLHYYNPAPPIMRIRSVSGDNGETKQCELLYENTIAHTRLAR